MIFLVTSVISLTAFFMISIITDSELGKVLAVIIPIFIILIAILLYIHEIRSLNRNKIKKELITSGELFSSQQWRQKYLEFKTKYEFPDIDPRGMRADLLKRFNCTLNRVLFLAGALSLAAAGFMIYKKHTDYDINSQKILGVLLVFGICLIPFGLTQILGRPVKKWLRQIGDEYKDIEDSYMQGKIITHMLNGINIGPAYIVFYNDYHVYSFRTSDIISVKKHILSEKEYNTGIYISTSYSYYLLFLVKEKDGISYNYKVMLDEYKSELACDVLRDVLQRSSDLDISLEETENNSIPIP